MVYAVICDVEGSAVGRQKKNKTCGDVVRRGRTKDEIKEGSKPDVLTGLR